uniref:Thioredox_DsbH domain-containing protein n=1 Tax=Macrostomum lignano TaxID=282301 RepID=A0A1I8FPS9_9PLAT
QQQPQQQLAGWLRQRPSPLEAAASSQASNRLHLSRSPYLAQPRQNDPVHWQPWGDEAFALAKARDQLVFPGIGYSTCPLLDREERPGRGPGVHELRAGPGQSAGWLAPLSVWLTRTSGLSLRAPTFRLRKQGTSAAPGGDAGTEILAALRKHAVAASAAVAAAFDPAAAPSCLRQLGAVPVRLGAGRLRPGPQFPQPSRWLFLLRLGRLRSAADPAESAEALWRCAPHALDCNGPAAASTTTSTAASTATPRNAKVAQDAVRPGASCAPPFRLSPRVSAPRRTPGRPRSFADTAVGNCGVRLSGAVTPAGGLLQRQGTPTRCRKGRLRIAAAGGHGPRQKEGAFCVWTWGQLAAAAVEGGSIGDVPYLKAFAAVYSCAEAAATWHPYQDPHDAWLRRPSNVLIGARPGGSWPQQLGLFSSSSCGQASRSACSGARGFERSDRRRIWTTRPAVCLNRSRLARARPVAEQSSFRVPNLWREDTRTLYRVAYPDGQDGVDPAAGA